MTAPRVRMLIYQFHPIVGGAERQCLALTRALRDRGLDARVSTFRLDAAHPAHEEIHGVPVTRIPRRRPAEANIPAWKRHLREIADTTDILHVHEANQAATVAAAWARRTMGKPYLVKCVNSGDRFDLKLAARKRWPYRAWLRAATLGADRAIAISSAVHDDLLSAGMPADRIAGIPNGVKLEHAGGTQTGGELREALGIPPDAPVVLRVGTLAPKKALPILFDAWRQVHAACPEAHLVSVGGFDGATPPAHAWLGGQHGDHAVGIQPGGVGRFLAAADIFVLPSLTEGLSNALLEAQAAGLPAVVTRVGGNPDVVRDGVNGRLVPPGDAEALARALIEVIRDRDTRARMQAAAREAAAPFSIDGVAERYERLYGELLEGPHG